MAVATLTTVAITLVLVVAVAVATAAARWVAAWAAWRRRLRLPPAPAPRGGAPPLVGFSHMRLALSEAESAEALTGAGDLGLVTTSLGPLTVVSALSAAAVRQVLALDGTGATGWWFPPPWRGAFGASSLFFQAGAEHAADHATALRCLSGAATDALVPSLELRVELMLNEWCAAGIACSAYPKCKMAALLLLTEGLFGRVVDERTCAKMARLYDDVNRFFTSLVPFDLPGTSLRTAVRSRKQVAMLLEEEVAKLVVKRAAGTLTPSEQACILNTLISSWPMQAGSGGPAAVPSKLLDNAMTFLFHGADCLSSAMLAATRYVCEDEATRLAIKGELEVAGVVGGRHLDALTLRQLPILQSVVMEALRLYPPIPLMHRVVTEPVTLCGYSLEPGQLLSYAIRTPHLDRRVWGDTAHSFCPTRHLRGGGGASSAAERHDGAPAAARRREPTAADTPTAPLWIPFGNGTRHCPGAELATVALCVYLAQLVRDHKLEVEGKVRLLTMPPHVRPDFDVRVRRCAPVKQQGGGRKAVGSDQPPTHLTRAPSSACSSPTSVSTHQLL
ncbi:hypothetical protein MMPV_004311 [Pyropia vietnamensis]